MSLFLAYDKYRGLCYLVVATPKLYRVTIWENDDPGAGPVRTMVDRSLTSLIDRAFAWMDEYKKERLP